MKIQTKITTSGPIMTGQAKPNLRGLVGGVESIVIGHILERTSKGVDVNGTSFKPYHPDYSLIRRLTGRAAAPVALNWSGKLMNAVGAMSLVDGTRFVVTFLVKPRDGRNLIAGYLQRTRKWFGMSKDGTDVVTKFIRDNLKRALYGLPLLRPVRKPTPPAVRDEKRTRQRTERGSIRKDALAERAQIRADRAARRANPRT